jgi:signal transduction histidine kinase
MDLRLISNDGDLRKLCQAVLDELPGRDWHLSTAKTVHDISKTDFYIWDFHPDAELPRDIGRVLSNHLFLTSRNGVARLHDRLGRNGLHVLLKPFTRATLAAILEPAASLHAARISSTDICGDDRDGILQGLAQANLRLQEGDQDRTNFLARGLHDFRAPLTAILGYCGLLRAGALGPLNEDQKEVLHRMHHSTKRLSRMASAMFQLNVGRDVTKPANLDANGLRDCIEQALHEVRPIADGKNISISVDLDPITSWLHFEPGLMEQVLINLLENACKFTRKAGQIRVRGGPLFWERRSLPRAGPPVAERRRQCCGSPNAYRIDILDSGAPISSEHLENLFKVDTSNQGGPRRSGGGVGLVICRMAIDQHEGRIWAQNTDDGPEFSIVLPVHFEGGQDTPRSLDTHISEVYQ